MYLEHKTYFIDIYGIYFFLPFTDMEGKIFFFLILVVS